MDNTKKIPKLSFGPSSGKIPNKQEDKKDKEVSKPKEDIISKKKAKGKHTYYHSTENNKWIERVKYWDRRGSQGEVLDEALQLYKEHLKKQGKIYEPTPDETEE